MEYVFGVILIVAGVVQILFRSRIVRANAASNAAMYNGRLAGPGFQAWTRVSAVIVGLAFIVFGILIMVFHGHVKW